MRVSGCLVLAAMTAAGPALAQVVINEVDYDQSGPDEADFIELHNDGDRPIDLGGHVIELVDDAGGTLDLYRRVELPAVATIPAGGFYVVCVAQEVTSSCDVAAPIEGDFLRNGPLNAVGLRDAGGRLLDALSYEGSAGAPYTEGTGVTAGNPALVFASIGRFPDGADTQDNSADFIGACATPGHANVDSIGECCGDGEVNGDEECDEGRQNGRVPCGCRADCTLAPIASACEAAPCEIGTCDADGDCVEPTLAPAGTPCGDRVDGDCTAIDTCDSAGNCLANDAVDGQVCDDGTGCAGSCVSGACETLECEAPGEPEGEDAGGGGCACQSGGAGGLPAAVLALAILGWRRRQTRLSR